MSKTDSLIRTKLRWPFTRPGLVSRPRLQEQILQGLHTPLTLITAPAGFGKTTLVASCLVEAGLPVAWLSLDPNDNQADRFLRYLVAALQTAGPSLGCEALQLLSEAQPALPEAVLTSLVNDLDTTAREVVLVLDDYQFIHAQAVHDQVAFLLEHAPTTFHLVIATRSDPALPLARLRARAQTVELRAADLRFTAPEAAQFLDEVMGLHLEAGPVAALAERTEGWIAGLQMAALSMRDRQDLPGFIAGFSGTNRYILDYLMEEVLASQTPEIQHFLLNTSILERLAAPLCDRLLALSQPDSGQPSLLPSAPVLEYLERANLFLVPLDDERTWYRYHHLFADLLRARLHQAQPERVPRLHIQAAAWLEQNDFLTEAIHHLCAAGQMGQAADLIERCGPARLADGDPSILQLAEVLPPEMLLARPKIGLYQAWYHIIHGHIGKALPLLHGLAQQLSASSAAPGDARQQPWMKTFVVLALAFLHPAPNAPGAEPLPAEDVLDQIPPEELVLRNAADFLYGMALARRGEHPRAVDVALQCIQREKSLPGRLGIPTLAPFLTRIYLIQGRLHAAAALCREFLDPLKERGIRFVYTAGSIEIDLGEVLYEWNCLPEAEQHIRAGLQANQPWKNIMTEAFGLVALARLLAARGDYAGALQVVDGLEARLQELPRPREFEEDVRTLRYRVLLAAGDLPAVSAWAQQVQFSPDFERHPKRYRLTLARLYLAQGRWAEVEKLLAGTVPEEPVGSLVGRQIETHLLLAAALARLTRMPEAFRWIAAALALAEPEGHLRAFLDLGEPARELLAAYLRQAAPEHKPFAQKVLQAFSTPASPAPAQLAEPAQTDGRAQTAGRAQPDGLVEPLTARELEVLRLMAQGWTNPDIARQLVVAPGTIKAHAASIYRKLDVTNRTQAVARARALSILP